MLWPRCSCIPYGTFTHTGTRVDKTTGDHLFSGRAYEFQQVLQTRCGSRDKTKLKIAELYANTERFGAVNIVGSEN